MPAGALHFCLTTKTKYEEGISERKAAFDPYLAFS